MRYIAVIAFAILFSSLVSAKTGIISVESQFSVEKTADRFESILKNKGLSIFARINHQKNAQGVGLELRPTELIIFGNPKIGTPLMQCAQLVAIDLPQKMLITEDPDGLVWLSYNNPDYLKERHNIQGCDKVIEKIKQALNMLSKAASSD
jgi:uncharacterized protein (DUF302 family)